MAKSRRNRRNKRRSRRSQRGGGGCSAQYNRNSFGQVGGGGCSAQMRGQVGGALSEYSTGDATLLSRDGMTHAQSLQQVNDINSLAGLIPKQSGGFRRRTQRGGMDTLSGVEPLLGGVSKYRQRGGMDSFSGAEPPLFAGMQVGASRHRQHGGMDSFSGAEPPLFAGMQVGASRRKRKNRRTRRQRGGMMEYSKAYVTPQVLNGTSFAKMDDGSLGYGFNPLKGAQ